MGIIVQQFNTRLSPSGSPLRKCAARPLLPRPAHAPKAPGGVGIPRATQSETSQESLKRTSLSTCRSSGCFLHSINPGGSDEKPTGREIIETTSIGSRQFLSTTCCQCQTRAFMSLGVPLVPCLSSCLSCRKELFALPKAFSKSFPCLQAMSGHSLCRTCHPEHLPS